MASTFKHKAVVAIDFGTTRSGYAFSFNDPTNIKVNEFQYQGVLEKIPTTLILKGKPKDVQFVAFGTEAEDKLPYVMRHKEIHAFKYYKMGLLNHQQALKSITCSEAHISIDKIIEYTIGFLYSCAMEELRNITNYESKRVSIPTEVQWVITVPAIWDNAAKQVMRKAAERIGIPNNLILALEPEAAALCCRLSRTDLKFTPGTKYMIIDCGGGTVDIVFHEIDAEGNTLEFRTPTGGPWGSLRVNKNFEQLLLQLLENEIDQEAYENVLSMFEEEKTKFNRTQMYNVKIKFENGWLVIPNEVMESFFELPISQTISCIEKSLESLNQNSLDYIFLVGGFSRNSILRERIMMKFEGITKPKIIFPENPHRAVVEGAVHFGLNPKIILYRFSAFSYGILCTVPWEDHHPVKYKKEINGKLLCNNVFCLFVKVNERVKQDFKVVQWSGPSVNGQTGLTFAIYTTNDPYLKYITDDMKAIGTLYIRLPPNENEGTYNIKVTMHFGGTEIKATAKHKITKESIACFIDFAFVSGLHGVN